MERYGLHAPIQRFGVLFAPLPAGSKEAQGAPAPSPEVGGPGFGYAVDRLPLSSVVYSILVGVIIRHLSPHMQQARPQVSRVYEPVSMSGAVTRLTAVPVGRDVTGVGSCSWSLGPAGRNCELDCRDFMYHNFSASYALHITCKHPYRPRGR